MGKHHNNQHNGPQHYEPAPAPTPVPDINVAEPPVPTLDPTPNPTPTPVELEVVGMVTNCSKLNIRMAPDKSADVVAEIPAGTKMTIDPDESADEWYKVCTVAGIEGYCMKQFVEVEQ